MAEIKNRDCARSSRRLAGCIRAIPFRCGRHGRTAARLCALGYQLRHHPGGALPFAAACRRVGPLELDAAGVPITECVDATSVAGVRPIARRRNPLEEFRSHGARRLAIHLSVHVLESIVWFARLFPPTTEGLPCFAIVCARKACQTKRWWRGTLGTVIDATDGNAAAHGADPCGRAP